MYRRSGIVKFQIRNKKRTFISSVFFFSEIEICFLMNLNYSKMHILVYRLIQMNWLPLISFPFVLRLINPSALLCAQFKYFRFIVFFLFRSCIKHRATRVHTHTMHKQVINKCPKVNRPLQCCSAGNWNLQGLLFFVFSSSLLFFFSGRFLCQIAQCYQKFRSFINDAATVCNCWIDTFVFRSDCTVATDNTERQAIKIRNGQKQRANYRSCTLTPEVHRVSVCMGFIIESVTRLGCLCDIEEFFQFALYTNHKSRSIKLIGWRVFFFYCGAWIEFKLALNTYALLFVSSRMNVYGICVRLIGCTKKITATTTTAPPPTVAQRYIAADGYTTV